jgi:transglutaminase-like putative cysteine protease
MRYRVTHRTSYAYSVPVVLCHNEARLEPRETAGQHCLQSSVMVEPTPTERAAREDFFGNRVLYFSVEEKHEQLAVTATSEVELVAPAATPDLDASPAWEAVRDALAQPTDAETRVARQFVLDSTCAAAAPETRAYAEPSFVPGRPILSAVADLSRRIHREFRFDPESTTVSTAVAEVLAQHHGVCQDFAHLAIACLRSLGLPARTSAAIWKPRPHPDCRTCRASTPRTPGSPSTRRASAGSTSIPPTTACRLSGTSPQRGAATTATSHRSRA